VSPVTYFPEVECIVSAGLRDTDITVRVPDEKGQRICLRVGKSVVTRQGRTTYLPVRIVRLDYAHRRVLIELPAGFPPTNWLWVPFASCRQEQAVGAMAA
jgi:hypothetical protein